MSILRTRGRVWLAAASGVAALVVGLWTYRQSGLSWVTLAVTIVGAGCVAAMIILWRASDETAKTLDALRNDRDKSGAGRS
jgi:hypothetical protein